MPRATKKVLFLGTLYTVLLAGLANIVSGSITFLYGVDGVKSWGSLCEIEDCDQLPPLHMTYEIDGERYYFPSSIQQSDRSTINTSSFFAFLPIGHKRGETPFRRTIRIGQSCCIGWGPLDFDFYLETRPDHTISRGFGRINKHTDTIRFASGVLKKLPEYFGIYTTHPSGELRDFGFFIHSSNSRMDRFLLDSHLRSLHQRTRGYILNAEHPKQFMSIRSPSDLARANFPSYNDAFWIVADRRRDDDRSWAQFNGIAVVSKSPMLHGRHVYGICNTGCQFYSLWFPDEPTNHEPLLKVEMQGSDIDVLMNRSCANRIHDPSCDPEKVSLSHIRLRFEVVEHVVEALRERPVSRVE